MFFCHALNKQKGHTDSKDTPSRILEVTCFERHSTPGGVWRASGSNCGDEEATMCAYSELWTNGPCHSLEFYDHTFDEHFDGESVPVYLPRRDINEYIIQRVTKEAPTFFDDYFEFHTEVLRVQDVDEPDGAFKVTIRNVKTSDTSTRYFDKCIWAAGENSRPATPSQLRALFSQHLPDSWSDESIPSSQSIPKLRLLHSSETAQMKKSVWDQRVLLIGGGFSAEDLALQCLKWGATHVDVVARSDEAEITWTSSWPGDRVKVHAEMAVKSVDADGTIVLEEVHFDWPHHYESASSATNDENESNNANQVNHMDSITCLQNINLVIFCTGYKANLGMLDTSLRPTSGYLPAWHMGMDSSMSLCNEAGFSWEDWKMDPSNIAHKYTGNIPAAKMRMIRGNYNHPDMHRGILFKNPNMIYLCEYGSDVPLLSLDVHAWLICSYLTGRIPTPSVEEMKSANMQQVLDEMNLPYLRFLMDEGYCKILSGVKPLDASDCGYWPKDKHTEKCGYWDASTQYSEYMFRLMARVMEEGQYPGVSFGTYNKLNKKGKAMVEFGMSCYYMRNDLKDYNEGTEWRTFRDDVVEPEYIHSLYTGSEARPLKKRWMDAIGPSCSVKNGDI